MVARRGRLEWRMLPLAVMWLGCLGPGGSGALGQAKPAGTAQRAESPRQRGGGLTINPTTGFSKSHLLTWPRIFRALIDYKQKFGHCQVPDEGRVLSGWISSQTRKRG